MSAVAYDVVYQPNSVSQDLVTSKLRISKHNVTLPRLELISTHMGTNLVHKCNISMRKSKREISHRLNRQHSSSVLTKRERKLQAVCWK